MRGLLLAVAVLGVFATVTEASARYVHDNGTRCIPTRGQNGRTMLVCGRTPQSYAPNQIRHCAPIFNRATRQYHTICR